MRIYVNTIYAVNLGRHPIQRTPSPTELDGIGKGVLCRAEDRMLSRVRSTFHHLIKRSGTTDTMMAEFSEYGRWPKMIAYPVQAMLSIALWFGLVKLFW